MTALDQATFERAVEIHNHQRLCTHEAAHAAAALVQGLDVTEAWVERHTLDSLEHADLSQPAGAVTIRRDPDRLRETAIVTIAGRLEEGDPTWPPTRWPLSLAPMTPDEQDLGESVAALGLDEKGYHQLVADAYELCASREFEHLALAIGHALEIHGRLDSTALRRIKAIAEEKDMEHATKAATVTVADRGEFTAIAATYTVDRQNDVIVPGAFGKSIARWQASSKNVPVHWNHEGDAASIIGSIDPHTMRETDQGLEVSGRLDLNDSGTAREAWRSMKNNAMSLSFGYVTTKSHKRSDGVQVLEELDLFEISIVPAPAQPDTRIVHMKSIDHDLDRIRTEWRDQMTAVLRAGSGTKAVETLRQKSERVAREHGPIQVRSFEC
jgi:HK97 family phage prohead protease